LEEGCKFGGQCKGYHRKLNPEEGKCYVCGSVKHQAFECDRPKRDTSSKGGKGDGAKKGKPGTKGTKGEGGKGKPVVKQLNTEESEGVSSTRELKAEGSDPREPEREPEKFEKVLDAFHTTVVKALKSSSASTQLEDLDSIIGSIKDKLGVNVKAIKIKRLNEDLKFGLLDSGATNNVRAIKDNEDMSFASPIEVEVAFDSEVQAQLFINREGTILGPKGTESIVSMNLLVKELQYEVQWTEGSLKVSKGEGKDEEVLPVEVVNGTPMLPNKVCLRLIEAMEEKRKIKVKAVKGPEQFTISDIWPQMKQLITWLMKNDIEKGKELMTACALRRKKEVEDWQEKISIQKDLMLEQVKNRKDQKVPTILVEVCCYEESKLSGRMIAEGGGAIRLSLPKHDISKAETCEGFNEAVKQLKDEGFKVKVWYSIPCSPWCSWQRVNLKIVEGFEEVLFQKREESLKLIRSVQEMIKNSKTESYFEWPKNNDGWKTEEVKEVMKLLPFSTEVDGCAYGLKNQEGRPMKKTWKFISNERKVKDYLNKTCKGHKEDHAAVRGKDGKMTEEYTEELAEEIINCMLNKGSMPNLRVVKHALTEDELRRHERTGHHPFDQRCQHCLLGGMKDRAHFRRDPYQRE